MTGRRVLLSDDEHAWLEKVAAAASTATRAPAALLGEYLPMLADAAVHGRRPQEWELDAVRELGRRAAADGVEARIAVDLYLSAAWRLWRRLPVVARSDDPEKVRASAEAVLRVLDDAVGVLVDGHQSARREMIRHEEALRREFVDDLLRGDADVSRMVLRAEPFGLELGRPHHVALVTSRRVANGGGSDGGGSDGIGSDGIGSDGIDRTATSLERLVVDRFGDRDVLVATKDDQVVLVLPGPPGGSPASTDSLAVGRVVHRLLERQPGAAGPWQVAVGRAFPGAYGIARSYEEARESLALAVRLGLTAPVIDARDLLVHRVLGRDREAMVDLVSDVLAPLRQVRGGPRALLDTLQAYFDAGDVATEAARRLQVSVRTDTYRLARVAELTGNSVGVPDQRFALQAAVLGARLLDWPACPLPAQ
jgi:sugar diacid utilization regulator